MCTTKSVNLVFQVAPSSYEPASGRAPQPKPQPTVRPPSCVCTHKSRILYIHLYTSPFVHLSRQWRPTCKPWFLLTRGKLSFLFLFSMQGSLQTERSTRISPILSNCCSPLGPLLLRYSQHHIKVHIHHPSRKRSGSPPANLPHVSDTTVLTPHRAPLCPIRQPLGATVVSRLSTKRGRPVPSDHLRRLSWEYPPLSDLRVRFWCQNNLIVGLDPPKGPNRVKGDWTRTKYKAQIG